MAEIHVQAKKRSSSAWLWILITIIIVAAVAFYLVWNNNKVRDNVNNKPAQTSIVQYPSQQVA